VLVHVSGSVESPADGLSETKAASAELRGEDDETAEVRFKRGHEWSASRGGFEVLLGDLKELFDMLEFAEDRLEGGEGPLAKFRRAAAATSAARAVEERPC